MTPLRIDRSQPARVRQPPSPRDETPFDIDLLHPGQFARTWTDWFASPQAKRLLGILYVIGIVGGLIMVADFFYETTSLRDTLAWERQRSGELQGRIDKRRTEVAQQRSQFQGISELEKFQVVWSEVLQALSEGIPETLWLNRIEVSQPVAQPIPQAVAGAAPPPRPPLTLRVEIATELEPGSVRLLEVARFLDTLGEDRRFAQKFQMEDWQATSSATGGAGGQPKEQLTLTVSFKVVP